jgi:uncharacterized protein YlzI (FlbEa/FlbD family)
VKDRRLTQSINDENAVQLISMNNPVVKEIREVLDRVSAFKKKQGDTTLK